MKLCPECALANEDGFPTCAWCNTVIVGVASLPEIDSTPAELEAKALSARRGRLTRWQVFCASVVYAAGIAGLAIMPGFMFSIEPLAIYFVTALLVAFGIHRGWLGQFTSAFLQGAGSSAIVLLLSRADLVTVHPFLFFMLIGHIVFASALCLRIDMIHSAHR
jgi:hypothetical protein